MPLTDTFEAPGNIGDGRRWGIEVESSLPLNALGLHGAKLDVKGRWQDSAVTDPVMGQNRPLSATGGFYGPPSYKFNSENNYTFNIAYRQDLQADRLAWGWNVADHAERPLYKVNELDTYHEGTLVNAFVETTRWLGVKTRFEASNLLDYQETRERLIYAGRRSINPLELVRLRARNPGRRLTLSISGSF